MIINDFYETLPVTRYTHTQFTDTVDNIGITNANFTIAYNVGFISPDVIPRMHRISRYELSGNILTVTDVTANENIDVLYTASTDNPMSNSTQRAMKYDEIWKKTHTIDSNTPLYNINLVNSVNVNETSMDCQQIKICFHFAGETNRYSNRVVNYYCGWELYSNFSDFVNAIENDKESSVLIGARPDTPDANYDTSFNFTFKPSDFSNGFVNVDTTSRDGRYYIRGIVYCVGLVNYYSASDNWQGKNWNNTDASFSTNLYNSYVVKTIDGNNFISAMTCQYGVRDYIDRYNIGGAKMPYISTSYAVNSGGYCYGGCNISVDITTTEYYVIGDGCVFVNDSDIPRIYLLLTFDDILKQLILQPRIYTGNNYRNDGYNYSASVIYPEIINNEFTGNYITYADRNKLTNWQIDGHIADFNTYNSETDKPPYIPKTQDDFGDLTSNIGLNTQTVTTGKLYKISTYNAFNVLNTIAGTYSTDTILSASDGLISFSYYPFDIPSQNVSQPVKIGAYNDNGEIHGFPLPVNVNYYQVTQTAVVIDLGSTFINSYYGDFRDYAPYSTYSAFIPYVNTSYNIDFAVFKNHNIGFKLIVDVLTGSGICCIMRDNLLYDTINATVSTQININSADIAQYNASIKSTENAMQANELNAKLAMVNAVTGVTTALVSSNPMGAVNSLSTGLSAVVNSALQRDMLQYQLSTTQVHHSTIQSASANCGNQLERQVHIIIAHAKMADDYNADVYKKTVGFACCKNDSISNCSNFTQIADIDLTGLTITDVEKNMIKTALINGVIIK